MHLPCHFIICVFTCLFFSLKFKFFEDKDQVIPFFPRFLVEYLADNKERKLLQKGFMSCCFPNVHYNWADWSFHCQLVTWFLADSGRVFTTTVVHKRTQQLFTSLASPTPVPGVLKTGREQLAESRTVLGALFSTQTLSQYSIFEAAFPSDCRKIIHCWHKGSTSFLWDIKSSF